MSFFNYIPLLLSLSGLFLALGCLLHDRISVRSKLNEIEFRYIENEISNIIISNNYDIPNWRYYLELINSFTTFKSMDHIRSKNWKFDLKISKYSFLNGYSFLGYRCLIDSPEQFDTLLKESINPFFMSNLIKFSEDKNYNDVLKFVYKLYEVDKTNKILFNYLLYHTQLDFNKYYFKQKKTFWDSSIDFIFFNNSLSNSYNFLIGISSFLEDKFILPKNETKIPDTENLLLISGTKPSNKRKRYHLKK